MFGLYVFGRDVERTIGRLRVAALYVASVVSGALVQIAVSLVSTHSYPTIGASAGVFGLLVSYAMLFRTAAWSCCSRPFRCRRGCSQPVMACSNSFWARAAKKPTSLILRI